VIAVLVRGRTLGLVRGRALGLVRGRALGLGRAGILSAAGGLTLAAIPVWPRGASPGLACAVARAGTARARIR